MWQRITQQLTAARNALNIYVLPFIARTTAAKENLYAGWATITAIRTTKETLEENALQMGREERMADENLDRSRYVFNASDPGSQQMTGNKTLTLVDEGGTPHLYNIDTDPDYLSTALFGDGTINYYPSGAVTSAVQPNDDQLLIEADGGYVVTKKNKEDRHYNYYGQIEKIIDPNGNETIFAYDLSYELIKITGPFGREIILERQATRIISAMDPEGRTYTYSYDSEGRLSSVVNPGDLTIEYAYSELFSMSITFVDRKI